MPRVSCRAVVDLVILYIVKTGLWGPIASCSPLHRLMTGSVATWLRPLATAACGAATGHLSVMLGPWPPWCVTSSQKTRQSTRAQLWPCTSCPRTPIIASPCTRKGWSRSVVVLLKLDLWLLTSIFVVANFQSSYLFSLFGAFETKSGIITLRKMCLASHHSCFSDVWKTLSNKLWKAVTIFRAFDQWSRNKVGFIRWRKYDSTF